MKKQRIDLERQITALEDQLSSEHEKQKSLEEEHQQQLLQLQVRSPYDLALTNSLFLTFISNEIY